MTCCDTIEDLGCIYSCDTVQIGVSASATGTYTIVLMPDLIQVVSVTITAAQPIAFPGGYLNEDGRSIFKIKKPDGTYLTDCYQVEIRPTTNPTLASTDVTPLDCECTYDIYINSVFSQQVTLVNCDDLTINLV